VDKKGSFFLFRCPPQPSPTYPTVKAKREYLAYESSAASFLCYEVVLPRFNFYWHHHPEYEITFIEYGSGTRFIGDHIAPFASGDMVLVGSDLPHTWVSEAPGASHYKAWVLQFPTAFVESICKWPELAVLAKLFSKSECGLLFSGHNPDDMKALMQRISLESGFERLKSLLDLFGILCGLHVNLLVSPAYGKKLPLSGEKRIHRVYQYIGEHFTQKITLGEVARHAFLSNSAFCKFFKQASGRTFSDYVNELRVGHAVDLLIETDLPINLVAAQCGFDNLAYFNRVFLEKKKIQPNRFRKAHARP
jgi:AraC-like DNA-binding protein